MRRVWFFINVILNDVTEMSGLEKYFGLYLLVALTQCVEFPFSNGLMLFKIPNAPPSKTETPVLRK